MRHIFEFPIIALERTGELSTGPEQIPFPRLLPIVDFPNPSPTRRATMAGLPAGLESVAGVPAPETKASTEIKDLLPLLDKRGLECLNQDSKHPITHAVDEVI